MKSFLSLSLYLVLLVGCFSPQPCNTLPTKKTQAHVTNTLPCEPIQSTIPPLQLAEVKKLENFGLPDEVWNACQYNHNGSLILDMSTDKWKGLSVSEQQYYARMYQQNYADSINEQAEKKIFGGDVWLEMRLIPPGRFWMGAQDSKKANDDEKPHRVIISQAYWLSKYEVTQAQWYAVMENNPSYFHRAGKQGPVDSVSWNKCQDYCNKVGMQLPTEAQWEYACRSGATRAYYWGDNADLLGKYGWYASNAGKMTHTVGQKNPNAFGLYDMYGNVLEWCADYCNCTTYTYPIVADTDSHAEAICKIRDALRCFNRIVTDTYIDNIIDPICKSGTHRLLRGGCWYDEPNSCRSAARHLLFPSNHYHNIGFRCVKPVVQSQRGI